MASMRLFIFYLSHRLVRVCEIELSHVGKNKGKIPIWCVRIRATLPVMIPITQTSSMNLEGCPARIQCIFDYFCSVHNCKTEIKNKYAPNYILLYKPI